MTNIILDNLNVVSNAQYINWHKLSGSTVLVTGATGLIGGAIIKSLLFVSKTKGLNIRIIALVRNIAKAKACFSDCADLKEKLYFYEQNICEKIKIDESINYIIHSACPTASNFFVNNPVDTIDSIVLGTRSMLEYAKEKSVKRFVYLSSMEVYGSYESSEALTENISGGLNTMSIRSCYPIAKQLVENLCCCYSEQYGVNANIVRLAQTFGPGVDKSDNRVFAYFARCALNKENIVLQTKGTSSRMYLHVYDSVNAILTLLLNGENGQIYNVANKDTYCSVYEMAQMVVHDIAGDKISVKIISDSNKRFPPEHYINLSTDKIKALGWNANKSLIEMYGDMIEYWKEYTEN